VITIGFTFLIIGMFGFAFSSNQFYLYAALVPYVFGGIAGPTIQSIISNKVPDTEQGNLQGALTSMVSLTILSGLLFYKQSKIVLGATGILAWLMLFVAHMNALDPEITNLVPVLKSYWLMIHVAIITGSYGFLGLGAILGLIIMLMNIFLTKNNFKRVTMTTKELSYVSEMVIMIGLFMLTVGTFLGGIWANESWGRYWGWDAKETWALVSVLVYAMVLHFRFIPGLKSQFVFNLSSLWAYFSIIMTFFGVNFYLSGLHSYATGDPMPIPVWVPTTVIILFVLTVLSGLRLRAAKKGK
jgi:cytochrome c-type biogenesis protein CcsB